MKKYDSYKDSGIEWMGEIPSHWYNSKIKYLSKEPGSLFIDGDWIESKVIIEEGIRYITTGNIKVGYYSEQGSGFISEETFINLNCTEVFEGDLVISRLNNPIGRACIIPNLNSRIVTSVDNVIFRPDSNVNKYYLLYLFSSKEYFEITDLISRGATMQRISRGLYGNIKIPLPPIEEQNTIANYLFHKTTQIDHLITKKEQFIQLLEEERVAVINQAVTKGLDTSVPMKDSGIEWLGEIPEHWEVILFKRVISKIKDGTHGTFQRLSEGYPFLSAKNVYDDGLKISETESLISENDYLDITKNGFPKRNDLLITCVGTIGRTFVYDLDEPFAFQRSVTFIRFIENINPHYYKFYVQSSIYQNLLISLAKTSAQSGIYMNDLMNTYALKTPLNEQNSIVEFLKIKTYEIDKIVLKAQQEIELLKEYKSALISEVVSGKVDVSNEKLS